MQPESARLISKSVTMPRCNLTLKQKSQMIELSSELNTEQLAKRFRVHPTTVTRTLKKQEKILRQAGRVNLNFKTVQTNYNSEQHDSLVLEYIQAKQEANEPVTVSDICDKADEFAKGLGRLIKSKRAWWRRFRVRCNIVKSKKVKNSLAVKSQRSPGDDAAREQQAHGDDSSGKGSSFFQLTLPDKPKADLKKTRKTNLTRTKRNGTAPVINGDEAGLAECANANEKSAGPAPESSSTSES